MTAPVIGRFKVTCEACDATAYASDVEPHPDPRARLNEFSEGGDCPRGGGTACPHSTASREESEERRPDRLRARLRELREVLDTIRGRLDVAEARRGRGRSVNLPAMTAGTPLEVAITWPGDPLPDDRYQVGISVEAVAAIPPGTIRHQIKAGSRTVTGCTVIVSTPVDVTEGRAGLHVVAQP